MRVQSAAKLEDAFNGSFIANASADSPREEVLSVAVRFEIGKADKEQSRQHKSQTNQPTGPESPLSYQNTILSFVTVSR
ncbi:hypothetical protein [Erwinia sp. B116]|uniref:hypothetical protein n=1 Tax=Erwinia sp. B116 TaxID=1561024 RepID=UPI0011AF0BD5|nr:hypothetical protein [Erwinia sp. B116]